MSDGRDDKGKWVWAFVLGVIVGALLMGGIWMVQARQAQARAVREAEEALRAADKLVGEGKWREAEKSLKEAEHREKGGK